MKILRYFLLKLLIGILAITNLTAQPGTIKPHTENSQVVRDLSGVNWRMKMMLPGRGEAEGLHLLPPEDIETLVWNMATVPGDVYTDLWKAGVIDDPYFGRNSVKAQWVGQYEWWYAYQFTLTEDLSDQVVRIDFDGVDYSCDVWLNGQYLGGHEGAFSPFSFDVTEYLSSSQHWLASKNILIIRVNPPPVVNAGVAGRKTPWFGDYWRDLIPFGIWKPIRMVSTGAVRCNDLFANTTLNEDGSATVVLELEIENTDNAEKSINIISSLEGKNFKAEAVSKQSTHSVKPGISKVRHEYHLQDPALWWPWDLGDQNLYLAKVSLKEGQVNHDFTETSFGIREVSSAWNPGFTEDEVSFPRTTLINGKMHFIRSACWGGPPDIFVGRTSVAEYRRLLELAKGANLNNIRIFGWHPPEIPEFYEICDELGLTVWQDVVPLGTGNLSRDEEFRNAVIREAVDVIKVRRNHPSLIMIEGGEEMFLRSGDAMFTRQFLEALGDSLHNYCKLPYVPDSPLTCKTAQAAGYKPKEAVHALRYFYDMGKWLMEDWYQRLDFPIVPELAITSVPSVESLKKFIPEKELWPPGLSWGHHWADLTRLKMQNWDAFGDEKTGSLEEFVNATQDAQGMIFKNTIEHFRRNKPRTSGIALCHWITYWPDMKWGIIDNYQQPKRSYAYVKKAYQPLLVNFKFTKRRWETKEAFKGEIWIVNDLYESYHDCSVLLRIKNDEGQEIYRMNTDVDGIEENSSFQLASIEEKVLKKVEREFTLELELLDSEEELLSANDYLFLIGNQEEATKQFNNWNKRIMTDKGGKYDYPNYYRFFPTMREENDVQHNSDVEIPRASGFPEK
jgi:beta-mannosidase